MPSFLPRPDGYAIAFSFVTLGATLSGCPRPVPPNDVGSVDVGLADVPLIRLDVSAADAGERCPVVCGSSLVCCGAGEDCVADRCVPACDGARCGVGDALCCTGADLCVAGACRAPGATCNRDDACPVGENCEPLIGRCLPIPESAECSFRPPVGVFEPELQWSWTDGNIMSAPLVVQTSDDDGDGRIATSDVPDVVVTAYEGTMPPGRIVVLSGDDGHLLWESSGVNVCRFATSAAADIDGDGLIEIVALADCGSMGENTAHAVAFSNAGAIEWISSVLTPANYTAIAIADLDGDGSGEIVAGRNVLDSRGELLWSATELGVGHFNAPVIGNFDSDPELEISMGNTTFNHDGTVLWRGIAPTGTIAVGNVIDGAPCPQIVALSGTSVSVLNATTGALLWGPVSYETPASPFITLHSGTPTIADFDGDGDREIGVAGDERYIVFDPDLPTPSVSWSRPSEDFTVGSVGSTLFDFDADGHSEVVFNDECWLRILDGATGAELWRTPNTSGTLMEYPIVVDVDNDGNAELVSVSNATTLRCDTRPVPGHTGPTSGVRVWRDRLDHWVPTRTIWNEHTYHIDNVQEDGSLPLSEPPSWTTHNSYRLNALTDADAAFYAPDLVALSVGGNGGLCPDRARVYARIENRGSRGVAAGVRVAFYAGTPAAPGALLGVAESTASLLAGAGIAVEIDLSRPSLDADHRLEFFAVVDDDGTGAGQHSECREDNNTSESVSFDCSGLL